ncbi:hypothetical protein TWF718_003273 [Orbilia javanica]|uniref:Uncharacterized protein n=1 Tax=Orbilia javanica TaxID=47235 RepID=A0AAN8MKZ2_9PEZI
MMSIPRQLTETDIRFKKLLDATPMPKSVQLVYESLSRPKQPGQCGLGNTPNRSPHHELNKGLVVATKDLAHPCMKVGSSPSSVDRAPTLRTSLQSDNISIGSKGTAKAHRGGNFKKLIARAKDTNEIGSGTRTTGTKTASHRRRSNRQSGARDYWVLGSRRKTPVYNEMILSKGP